MLSEDDLTVREVEYQHLRFKGFTHDLSSVFERQVVDDTHSNDSWLGRMELDACNCSEFRVRCLVEELAGNSIGCVLVCSTCSDIIAELVKIVLENIDDFVRLKLALNSCRNSVDEGIKFLAKLGVVFQRLSRLANEILGIVRCDSVDRSVVVGLSLCVDHSSRRLEADLKLFALKHIHLTISLLDVLEIVGALTRLFINELTVIVISKLTAFH